MGRGLLPRNSVHGNRYVMATKYVLFQVNRSTIRNMSHVTIWCHWLPGLGDFYWQCDVTLALSDVIAQEIYSTIQPCATVPGNVTQVTDDVIVTSLPVGFINTQCFSLCQWIYSTDKTLVGNIIGPECVCVCLSWALIAKPSIYNVNLWHNFSGT